MVEVGDSKHDDKDIQIVTIVLVHKTPFMDINTINTCR